MSTRMQRRLGIPLEGLDNLDEFARHIGAIRAEYIANRGGVACDACGGAGTYVYATTATWRGGIGGQAMAADVCDRCWGSGVEGRPWPSHRLLGGGR